MNDIIATQHGKTVIARGKHRQPVSDTINPECPNCKYADLQAYEAPCNICKWNGDRLTNWEAKS